LFDRCEVSIDPSTNSELSTEFGAKSALVNVLSKSAVIPELGTFEIAIIVFYLYLSH